MYGALLSRSMAVMTSPSLITSAVAATVTDDHAKSARLVRSRGRNRLFGRRRGASRILVPRGRIASPSAH
jgi:hypothetical protein